MIGRYPYVPGGGHLWVPGEPPPRSYDCSGFTFYEFLSTLNIDLRVDGETTSEIQWGFALGGQIRRPVEVQIGMLVYFIDFAYPDPGHVGIVSQVNKSGVNTYVSAYDTALGIVEEPWTWGAGTFYGVTDPIATLPLPTPFEEDPMWLDVDPGNKYAILVCPAQGGWYGITAEKRNYYAANGVPSAKSPMTAQVFAELTKLG